MGRLSRPPGGGGGNKALRDLNNALHELHALASWPSLDDICAYLRSENDRRKKEKHPELVGISRVNVSRLFSTLKLPRPDLLLAVVEYLAKRAYRLDVDRVCDRFDELWRRALSEQVPPAPSPGWDDDGPDEGHQPARPRPRLPRPSGGAAADLRPSDGKPFSLLDIVDELRPSDPSASRDADPSARLLIVNQRRTDRPAETDRAIYRWWQALSMGRATVAEQPTAAEMRRLVAETLRRPVDTAVLWLEAPVVWDSATGEAHFVTRDSEFDADGTLWNTVSYTEIQYVVAQSSARAVFLVVVAGRSRRIADVYGTRAFVPVGRTQWMDTLYAVDVEDDGSSASAGTRPVFLLWLPDAGHRADYPGALLHEIQSGALLDSRLTTGAFLNRLQEVADRFGHPEPYADARHGGEEIVIGRWFSRRDTDSPQPWRLRLAECVTRDDLYRLSSLARDAWLNKTDQRLANLTVVDTPTGALWRHEGSADSRPALAGAPTATAAGRLEGRDVVVAAFADNALRLVDASTGQVIRTHPYGHTSPVTALAMGTIAGTDVLVVAFADNSVQLWDAHTGQLVQTLSPSIGPVTALAVCNVEYGDFVVAEDSKHQTWCWEVVPG